VEILAPPCTITGSSGTARVVCRAACMKYPSVSLSMGPQQQTQCCTAVGLLATAALGLTGKRVLPSRIMSQTLGLENFVIGCGSHNVLKT